MSRAEPIEAASPGASPASCPLVLACDEGYAMPLATTLRSVADGNRPHWPLAAYVLHDGFSAGARDKVLASLPEGSMNLHWVPVELGMFERFSLLGHVSRMTFARLQIPEVFADAASKVLYLDTDILVLGDLAELFQTDLGGAAVGAVLDFHVDAHLKAGQHDRIVGVPPVSDYFNAGVLLIDVQAWRRRGIAQRAIDYLRSHLDSPYADQDALNVACDGDWKQLDRTWNFQNHHVTRIAREPAATRPAIVHFVTSSKPWKPDSTSVNAAFYDGFRRRTRFRRSPGERAVAGVYTLGWRVKHRLDRINPWLEE